MSGVQLGGRESDLKLFRSVVWLNKPFSSDYVGSEYCNTEI